MVEAEHIPQRFIGFTAEAADFYRRLADDNSKKFWHANKAVWEDAVLGPLRALLAALEPDPSVFHVFRPYRDVRFSADKSPYKTMLGAGSPSADGTVRYLQISASGLMIASGCYAFTSDQVARFRHAVDDKRRGPALEAITAEIEAGHLAVESGGAAPLKTAPRGFTTDHPRIGLLRFRGLIAIEYITDPQALASSSMVDRVRASWETAGALREWLAANVGPPLDARPNFRPHG